MSAPADEEERAEARHVEKRAQYLSATTVLSDREAEALAWNELGYSEAVTARKIGATRPTVTRYIDRVVARYGIDAVAGRLSEREVDTPMEPVTVDDLKNYSGGVLGVWLDLAADHREDVPDAALDYAVGSGGGSK